jgi:hypothetical protein
MRSDPIKIFTWHIHGSYLYYLSQCNFEIYIPVIDKKKEGYIGRGTTFPFGENVIEVPVNHVKDLIFDCVLFQTTQNYSKDQYEVLSAEQRELPAIYLEHDPSLQVPTDARHLATTEMTTVLRDGESGIIHTDVDYLIRRMKQLLQNRPLAQQLGEAGQRVAHERFNIERFTLDWQNLVQRVIQNNHTTAHLHDSEEMMVL